MRSSFRLLLLLGLAWPSQALAADVLFVSDAMTDVNIADALRADGHVVTVVVGDWERVTQINRALGVPLDAYDCVIWSASGTGSGGLHSPATFENLTAYVEDGGRVLVTGFGSVGIGDRELITFLGATGGTSLSGSPGVVAASETTLTTGVVELAGITPTPYEFRYEGLTGLAAETVIVVMSSGSFGTPGAQWTLRAVGAGEIAYVANGAGTGTHPSWTATGAGAPGAYNAAIRNFVGASGGSADEPGAPTVRFMAPASVREGASVEIAVEVIDEEGDRFEVSWDLDGDGTYGENAGLLDYTFAAGMTDGRGSLSIGVSAVDVGGHRTERTRRIRIENVAPAISSTPPETASIGQNLQYVIAATDPAGPLDTLSFELVRGPSSASVVGGVFRFVPDEGDVTPEGMAIDCEIAVSDEDGGRTLQTWGMRVANDYAPTDLSLEFPTDDIVLADRTPRLVVRDGTDLDGGRMQYFFELDTSPSFDGASLIASGAIDESPGFTAFELTTPLLDGHYYWRAWLTDGTAITAPQMSSFYVVGAIGDLADAGADASLDGGSLPPPGPRDCACRASRPQNAPPLTLLVVSLSLAIMLGRRKGGRARSR
jgi:hypothetical protein